VVIVQALCMIWFGNFISYSPKNCQKCTETINDFFIQPCSETKMFTFSKKTCDKDDSGCLCWYILYTISL